MRSTPPQETTRQAGFTLLELIVAVTVFAVLTALAVPSFGTYLEKSRLRGASDEVVSQIAQARQVAVKFDRSVSLSTTGTGATWCLGAIQAADPVVGNQAAAPVACDCTASPATCKVDDREMVVGSAQHPGVSLSSAAAELVFDGRLGARTDASIGNADDSSFDLTSKSGRYVLTISVSPLGQARVCSQSGNILGYPAC